MRSKLILVVLVCAVSIPAVEISAQDQAEPQLRQAPPNPEFIAYQEKAEPGPGMGLTAGGFGLGRRPSPLDLSHATGQQVMLGGKLRLAYPASYDLRSVTNKLPPVRDQGSCGDCWAFATYGSLESWLRPAETTWDFSEMDLNCSHGFDWGPCGGGNRDISTAFLSRFEGPVLETCYPYGGSCLSPRPSCTKQKRVTEVIYLPDRANATDNDNIKNAVMTYGAVYTSMYWSDPAYRSAYTSHYYTGSSTGNHAVCIVGWDDNYDRTRFVSTAPSNGAFIVRNSWGPYWGASGYFYCSYYDTGIGIENGVFLNAEPIANYTRIYQYDPYGWVGNVGYTAPTAWCANIFTSVATETLKAVGFFTPVPNTAYQLYVYTNCSAGAPRSGTLAGSTSGTMANMGYHTIVLPTAATVTNGQRFSVVLSLNTPGFNYPVCVEYPYPGYCSGASASSGQGYLSYDGSSWMDLYNYDSTYSVCLRALIGPASDITPPTVTAVQVSGARTVDITFSEAMGTGVTTAGNYSLSGTGKGSLTANPNSVALVSGNTYRLTWTAGEMKNGGNITACASSNVKDTANNPMGSPNCGTHTGGGIGTAPTISFCASPLSAGANDNCQNWVLDFTRPDSGLIASDNVTPTYALVVTQSPLAGTLVGLGYTNVTVTVTDQAGNSSTCPTTFRVIDPDGDAVCGTHDQCPNSIPGAIVGADGCSHGPGDVDRDGDVDGEDLVLFIACGSGPAIPATGGCLNANFNADTDVDSDDFGIFQRCLSGENIPSDPNCAN